MVFQVGDRGPFVGRMPSVEKTNERPILQEEGPATLLSLTPVINEISQEDEQAIDAIINKWDFGEKEKMEHRQTRSFEDVASLVGETASEALPPLFSEDRLGGTLGEPIAGACFEELSLPPPPIFLDGSNDIKTTRKKRGKYNRRSVEAQIELADKIKMLTKSPDFWGPKNKPLYTHIATELGEDERQIRYFITQKMKGQLNPPVENKEKSAPKMGRGKYNWRSVEAQIELADKIKKLTKSPDFWGPKNKPLYTHIARELNEDYNYIYHLVTQKMKGQLNPPVENKEKSAPKMGRKKAAKPLDFAGEQKLVLPLANNPNYRDVNGTVLTSLIANDVNRSRPWVRKVLKKCRDSGLILQIEGVHPPGNFHAAKIKLKKLQKKDEELLGLITLPDDRFTVGEVQYGKIPQRTGNDVEKLEPADFSNLRGRVLHVKGNCEKEEDEEKSTPALELPPLDFFLFHSRDLKTKALGGEAVSSLRIEDQGTYEISTTRIEKKRVQSHPEK